MSRVKTHWHDDLLEGLDDDGRSQFLSWIAYTTGLLEHGGEFVDPETGEPVSLDEARCLAEKMDCPFWRQEQRLDAAAEWAGEERR